MKINPRLFLLAATLLWLPVALPADEPYPPPVKASGEKRVLVVSGDDTTQTVEADGQDVMIAGSRNNITINGACNSVTVSGSRNTVNIKGSCGTLTASGNANIIDVNVVQRIVTTGADNKITWHNSPDIDNPGSGNNITHPPG